MSSSNVNYCKYYRINVSYCIQKNWYLPLYRKIKSLLYIQLMTGMRGLPWKRDYNISARTTGGLVDLSTITEHLHAIRTHTWPHAQRLSHTHTLFLSGYFLSKTENNTLNTAQITRMSWKGNLVRGSGVILISPFLLPQTIIDWKFLLISSLLLGQ